VTQWVEHLTRNLSLVSLSLIKGSHCVIYINNIAYFTIKLRYMSTMYNLIKL